MTQLSPGLETHSRVDETDTVDLTIHDVSTAGYNYQIPGMTDDTPRPCLMQQTKTRQTQTT